MEQNQQQQDPTVTLTVKASWVNAIIGGLDELPHKYSRPIIDEISSQAKSQLELQPDGTLAAKIKP